MKIGIITFWDSNDNYGQILQYYATQTFLENNGHSPFLIKYKPEPIIVNKSLSTQILKLFNIVYVYKFINIRFIKPLISKIINKFILDHNINRGFNIFREKYFISTPILSTYDLYKNTPTADLYICGSDQIWSGAGNDKIFFLNFTKKNKIAWSVSFGRNFTSLSQIERNNIANLIKNFNFITVRENAGLEICKHLGRNDAKLICDPTLLNNTRKYDILVDTSINTTNGIFIYYLGHDSKLTDRKIINFFNKKGLDTFYCASQGKINNLKKIFPTIEQWLGCIKNAKFIVTNSFHGTVFCLLFNKEFATVPLKQEGANTRIYTLLSAIGLENRICHSIEELNKMYISKIDYQIINEKLKNIKRNSIEHIEYMFSKL